MFYNILCIKKKNTQKQEGQVHPKEAPFFEEVGVYRGKQGGS